MSLNKEKIIVLLPDHNKEEAEKFASYVVRLQLEKKKDGSLANPWMAPKGEAEMAELFRRVAKDGLVFDGKTIILTNTGINYGWQAYKNKMMLAYPESKIDVNLVYEGETFHYSNESGNVIYQHNVSEPFNQTDKNIVGGYCVIRNRRGDFITVLNKKDIEKRRKKAKMDAVWSEWEKEMTLKTVMKRGCTFYFYDIYESIEEKDNDNYNLENPLDLSLELKKTIDSIQSVEELQSYYGANKGLGAAFDKYIVIRMDQLKSSN